MKRIAVPFALFAFFFAAAFALGANRAAAARTHAVSPAAVAHVAASNSEGTSLCNGGRGCSKFQACCCDALGDHCFCTTTACL